MRWWPFGGTVGASGEVGVGLYGKLPCSPEFLRIHCLRGVGAVYRGWIERCVEFSGGLGDGWDLLLRPASGSEWIVARIRPSADAGGRRRFPVTIFMPLATGGSADSLATRIRIAATIWPRLAAIDERLDETAEQDLAAMLARASDATGGSDLVEAGHAGAAGAADAAATATPRASIEGVDHDDETLALRLWWAVLRGRSSGGLASTPATPLPLWPDEDRIVQSIRWVDWLDRQGVGGGPGDSIALAIPCGDPSLGIRVLARPVDRGDFDLWLGDEGATLPPRPDSSVFERLRAQVEVARLRDVGVAGLAAIDVEEA